METKEKFLRDMTSFLMDLRFSGRNKNINNELKSNIISSLELLENNLRGKIEIPKEIAKNLLYLFSATLTEAQCANNPDPIIETAWDFEEKIQQILE